MRNLYIGLTVIIICLSTALSGSAQNLIPNADFENWTDGTPDFWDTANENILGADFIGTTREMTNPQNGSYSAKIETVTNNIFLVGPVTLPGILTLGEVEIDILNQTGNITGGVPITGQPKFLHGYYKYTPQGGDSCILGIGLTKWNGTGRDTLAYSYAAKGTLVNTWTQFSVPVTYETWDMPDTMNILFISSNLLAGTFITGSTLWVDNLWLEYSGVSVNDIGASREVFVSAQNQSKTLLVNTPNQTPLQMSVFSLSGQQVNISTQINHQQSTINLSDLERGIYIVRVLMPGNKMHAVKFSVL